MSIDVIFDIDVELFTRFDGLSAADNSDDEESPVFVPHESNVVGFVTVVFVFDTTVVGCTNVSACTHFVVSTAVGGPVVVCASILDIEFVNGAVVVVVSTDVVVVVAVSKAVVVNVVEDATVVVAGRDVVFDRNTGDVDEGVNTVDVASVAVIVVGVDAVAVVVCRKNGGGGMAGPM